MSTTFNEHTPHNGNPMIVSIKEGPSPNALHSASPAPAPDPDPAYSTFTPKQKLFFSLVLGFLALASPLTATIYLPLLPLLQKHFHTSAQAINLTLTIFLIFQAVSPSLLAPPSDVFGRRSVFIFQFALYTIASIGLALNKDSYLMLLVFRAIQGMGSSAVLAVAYGAIADIDGPADRGSRQTVTMVASNLGTWLGPLLGGLLAWSTESFRWSFWVLVIFGVLALMLVGCTLPETARNVVGNGSINTDKWWTRTWLNSIKATSTRNRGTHAEKEHPPGGGRLSASGREIEGCNSDVPIPRLLDDIPPSTWREGIRRSNPLTCLRIIFYRDAALALCLNASTYIVWYIVQISIPPLYTEHGFNELYIGLAYLPGGFSSIVAQFVTGRFLDFNYRRTAKEEGFPVDSGHDVRHFPVERARVRNTWPSLLIFFSALIGFGWAVDTRVHPAVPLVLQAVISFLFTYFFQTFNTLLIDIFPRNPSTAVAAGNIVSSVLGGLAVAGVQPSVDVLGRGRFFTILAAVLTTVNVGALFLLLRKGKQWRQARLN